MSDYLNDRDVAAMFGISWQQVQQRCRTKQWPHIKIGRRYRFTEQHIKQIEAMSEVAPTDAPTETWGRRKRTA